jgi:hypothetical protein
MVDMAELIKFTRVRISPILIVYGTLTYFYTHSSRVASRVLNSMVRKSHAAIPSWFKSLSTLFMDRSLRGKVKLSLIDDTRVEMKVLTDGAQYYRTACKFLSLDHDAYGLKTRSIMERII